MVVVVVVVAAVSVAVEVAAATAAAEAVDFVSITFPFCQNGLCSRCP
jgi:hypothetical protein